MKLSLCVSMFHSSLQFDFVLLHRVPPHSAALLNLGDCSGTSGHFLLMAHFFLNQLMAFSCFSLLPWGCCWSQAQSPCAMLYLAHYTSVFEGFFHATTITFQRCFNTPGVFLYSLYVIPLGPGADADLACFTALFTLLHLGGLVSIWCSGGWSSDMSPGMVAGVRFLFPEKVLLRYSSSSLRLLKVP